MPIAVERRGSCFRVFNTDTGAVHARCTTKAKAEAQARLLRAVDHGWKPTGKKSSRMMGGALGSRNMLEIQYFRRKLHQLIPHYPEHREDLENMVGELDDILRSADMDFAQGYIDQVLQSARDLLNQFPTGWSEMKY